MVVQKFHPSEEIMYTVLLWRPLLQLYKWVLYFLCFWMQAANVFKWQDISWPDSTCISGCSVSFQEALGSRPAVIKATQHAASASEPSSLPAPQKVEGTKDLFDLLSLESDSNTATNDNEWAAFQCQCVLLISCPLTRCLNSASLDGVQAENLHALQQGHLSIGSWRFGIFNSRFKNLSNIYSFWENVFSSHTHSRSTHKLIASKRCSCHLLFGVF